MINVLLVEDNPMDVDLFIEYLEDYKDEYNIYVKNLLSDTLEFMEQNDDFDVIVLDLNLPDSNGISTFERVKKIKGEKPIIVLTGLSDQKLASSTLKDGAGDYLFKNKLNPYVIHKSIVHTIDREKNRILMKEKERQLLQNQKMESIGRLSTGIAHDFNNIITIISGYSDLLLNKCRSNKLGDEYILPIEEIKKSTKSGADLIHQLLLFCRKQETKSELLNLNETLDGFSIMLNRIIPKKIRLQLEVDSSQLLIKFNKINFEQIILNLIINAIDAINIREDEEYKGKIELIVKKIHQTGNPQEINNLNPKVEHIEITVADNGIGMSNEIKEQIFDPFFTTKELGEGTGLGLSTVYGLVVNNGGSINVESEIGKGTVFKLYLPSLSDMEVENNKFKVQNESFQINLDPSEILEGKTIMIVENDQKLKLMVSLFLNNLGFEVVIFASRAQALHYLDSSEVKKISLIIYGFELNELETATFINFVKNNIAVDMKWIILSDGLKMVKKANPDINEDDYDIISKPFETKEIENSIIRLLKQ